MSKSSEDRTYPNYSMAQKVRIHRKAQTWNGQITDETPEGDVGPKLRDEEWPVAHWMECLRQFREQTDRIAKIAQIGGTIRQVDGALLRGIVGLAKVFDGYTLTTADRNEVLDCRRLLKNAVLYIGERIGVDGTVLWRDAGIGESDAWDSFLVKLDSERFVESACGETITPSFTAWAGGTRITLAIVFTDVVGSTALGEQLKDERMNELRRAHFAQSRKLIVQYMGREIKTIGDSFMAAFRCAEQALDYARALQSDPGDSKLKIRAGIHIGPMQVEENDAFGGTVNYSARIVGTIKGSEIWLSDRTKNDLDSGGATQHAQLTWQRHDNVELKGFDGKCTLWSLNT